MAEPHSIEALSDEAFGWYLSGLTDGEGCFLLARRTGVRDGKRSWQTRFDLAMRDDETPHLEAVAWRVGCGKVFHWALKQRLIDRPNTRPKASWTTWRVGELARVIVPHFDRFPLQLKKARDFALWRRGILRLQAARGDKKHGDPRPISAEADAEIAELAAQIKAIREYASPAGTPPLPRARRGPSLFPD
jgi:hypothetical protein